MSLSSWMDEFYNESADSAAEGTWIHALKHSILKWIGLREANLEKHALHRKFGSNISDGYARLGIDSSSCALCIKAEHESNEVAGYVDGYCKYCPLDAFLGEPCYLRMLSPYFVFATIGDPEPMIKALEETLNKLEGSDASS